MQKTLSSLSHSARKVARAFISQATSRLGEGAGFTMIELLIVIAILGILAVAVLSAINPIEQINRGRDTGSKSDAEQLLSAIDRYQAFQGYYPWQIQPDTATRDMAFTEFSAAILDANNCPISEKLGTAVTAGCVGTDELKATYFNRVFAANYNPIYVYNQGLNLGDSTYVCFAPQSAAFQNEATTRCADAAGSGLPADIDAATAGIICDPGDNNPAGVTTELVCLP